MERVSARPDGDVPTGAIAGSAGIRRGSRRDQRPGAYHRLRRRRLSTQTADVDRAPIANVGHVFPHGCVPRLCDLHGRDGGGRRGMHLARRLDSPEASGNLHYDGCHGDLTEATRRFGFVSAKT